MTISNWGHIAEVVVDPEGFVPGVLHVRPMIELHEQHAKGEDEREVCTPTPGAEEWWPWQHGNPLADVPPAQPWTPRRAA